MQPRWRKISPGYDALNVKHILRIVEADMHKGQEALVVRLLLRSPLSSRFHVPGICITEFGEKL